MSSRILNGILNNSIQFYSMLFRDEWRGTICNRPEKINQQLLDIEDKIRDKERAKSFDDEFIQAARNVFITNDECSRVKRKINGIFWSELVSKFFTLIIEIGLCVWFLDMLLIHTSFKRVIVWMPNVFYQTWAKDKFG